MKTINKTTQIGLLVAALVGGALAAAATRGAPKSSSPRPAPEAVADLTTADVSQQSAPEQALKGRALEVIQVPNYTYVRFDVEPGRAVWAAVNSSPGLKQGDAVRVTQAQLMQNFHSASLNRDFEAIYFGVLDEPAAPVNPHAGGGNPHVAIGQNPHASGELGAGAPGTVNPHAQPTDVAGTDVGQVAKAKGQAGHTIAEMFAKKSALAGKTVRVRAVIVKSTPDVMGKTFAHVRDGSGSEASRDFDLTITTQEKPQLRQTVLLEGKLELDVDLGAGYKYPVILQDAHIVNE